MGLRVRVGDGLADGSGEAAVGLGGAGTRAWAVLPAAGAIPVTGVGACDVAVVARPSGALEVRVAVGAVLRPSHVAALVCEAA